MQNLYAFYINKRANYQGALDHIRAELAFDIFAEPRLDKPQQAVYQEQALTLFATLADEEETDLVAEIDQDTLAAYPIPVQAAVQKAQIYYASEVAKDLKKLQDSWPTIIDKLQKDGLLVLQLLIEWSRIAQ